MLPSQHVLFETPREICCLDIVGAELRRQEAKFLIDATRHAGIVHLPVA
jgi:hypothetical protein